MSGTSTALESLEPVFGQDLNGDGVIGLTKKVIKTDGSTSLTEVANRYYYLDGSSGSGPALKYHGADVTAGEFGGWTPIGAVKTASGYDVAWKNTSTGQYTVWTTDSNGNYTGNLIGAVSGTSTALEVARAHFRPRPKRRRSDRSLRCTQYHATDQQRSGRLIRIGNDRSWGDARARCSRYRLSNLPRHHGNVAT